MKSNKDNSEHKYLTYSIVVGMIIGTVIAVVTTLNIGICAGAGMLLGVVVGTTIDYQKNKEKKD